MQLSDSWSLCVFNNECFLGWVGGREEIGGCTIIGVFLFKRKENIAVCLMYTTLMSVCACMHRGGVGLTSRVHGNQ